MVFLPAYKSRGGKEKGSHSLLRNGTIRNMARKRKPARGYSTCRRKEGLSTTLLKPEPHEGRKRERVLFRPLAFCLLWKKPTISLSTPMGYCSAV